MRIENEIKLDYSDVLIRPKRSNMKSRSEVVLERTITFNDTSLKKNFSGIPLIASNMDGVGTFSMADTLAQMKIMTCLVKTYSIDELKKFYYDTEKRTNYVAMSIGTSYEDYDKFVQVINKVGNNLKYLCVDVANGYTQSFVTTIKNIRDRFPNIVIIAGNVVTGEMTEELILSGASIIKVGIGQGSVCKTRLVAGVGYPQLSAVIECADAAHGLGGHVIADGGCVYPGDIAKAFSGGADFVMLGGMLAGHAEGGGEIISKTYRTNEITIERVSNGFVYDESKMHDVYKTKQFVKFYGMSSAAANDAHFGGLKDYRASEGREVLVEYRGRAEKTIQEILGGLRSSCTYVGAKSLKELPKRATFIRCNDTHNRIFENKEIE